MPAATQVWSHVFAKALIRLPPGVQARVAEAIDSLGCRLDVFAHKRLQGSDAYRLRVGDYRVIYDFDVLEGTIHLLFVGHRREIYKDL
jgi:mRNA interferase RelE/StbE